MARMLSPGAVLLLSLACGPGKGDTDGGTTAETGSTGAASTGSGTAEATGPTTGPGLCDMFLPPDATGPAVEITVVHQGSAPLWVDVSGCGGAPRVEIVDADATVLSQPNAGCFPTLCHEFIGLDDCTQGCDDCAPPLLRRFDPGASFVVNWAGTYGLAAQMSAECAPGTNCQGACSILQQAAPGAYELRLRAFRGCTGGVCTCEAPADTCGIYEAVEGVDPVTFSVSLAYPDVTAIALPMTD